MIYAPPAPAGDTPFELLYVDAHMLVLNKPSGLLSVPGRGPDKQDCLSARVQRCYPDALIVHRLDMQTSGLLAMARGIDAQRALNRAFEQRLVHKRYQAVVDGLINVKDAKRLSTPPSPAGGRGVGGEGNGHDFHALGRLLKVMPVSIDGADEWGVIDLPLELDWPNRPKHIVDYQRGRPSVTRWRVLSPDSERHGTRLELEPVTGRSHQLRVHLQAIGHPILGDDLYASAEAAARACRLLLHACELSLPHPATGELMSFSSPPPF